MQKRARNEPAPVPPAPPVRDIGREVAYREKALELVKLYKMGGAAMALGMSRGSFAAWLLGECRRSTAAYAEAQMDALGWTPAGYRTAAPLAADE